MCVFKYYKKFTYQVDDQIKKKDLKSLRET